MNGSPANICEKLIENNLISGPAVIKIFEDHYSDIFDLDL